MWPCLVEIGDVKIPSYRVCLLVAVVVITVGILWESRRRLGPHRLTWEVGVYGYVGALLGARLWFVAQSGQWSHLWRILAMWEGGMSVYGGLLGGMAGTLVYLWSYRLPILATGDVAAPYLALGQAVARVGCFLAGCCYGRPTAALWGVRFPEGSLCYAHQVNDGLLSPDASTSLPVHPTQLYMIASLVAVFAVCRTLLARKPFDGFVCGAYSVLYCFVRVVVDAFRGDQTVVFWGIKPGQVLGFTLIFAGGLALVLGSIHHRMTRQAQTNKLAQPDQ